MTTSTNKRDRGRESADAPINLGRIGARPATRYAVGSMEQAFPEVDPEHEPMGSRVLVQMRTATRHTAGGLVLTEDSVETEKWNTQVGKVRAIGPLAFRNRDTFEEWKEGPWYAVGDFVRCPKYGGDRFEVEVDGSEDNAIFVVFNEADILARVTGDPLKQIAYITK